MLKGMRTWFFPSVAVCVLSCGGTAPPAKKAKAQTPEPPAAAATTQSTVASAPALPPITKLQTGTLLPVRTPPVQAQILEHGIVGPREVLRIALPTGWERNLRDPSGPRGRPVQTTPWVSVDGQVGLHGVWVESPPGAANVGNPSPPSTANVELWLQRPSGTAAQAWTVEVLFPWQDTARPPLLLPVAIAQKDYKAAKPRLQQRLRQATAEYFRNRHDLPFSAFAFERLAGSGAKVQSDTKTDWRKAADWSNLMEITTGIRSVRAAIQSRSKLRSEVDKYRPRIAFSKLTPPQIQRHPWEQMLKLLAKPVPAEPLAKAVPADFYYARTNDIAALFQLLDEVDAWGTPLAHLLEGQTEQRLLEDRYRTQLALPGTELTEHLGAQVIERLALVGSDPFLRQGSDVSLLFQVKNVSLFRAGLARNRMLAERAHGTLTHSSVTHQGVEVQLIASSDGAVRRYQTSHKGIEIVSNSKQAIQRIIDTVDSREAALASELDFQYMLARDAGVKEQVLLYAGDRFIEGALGPRSRILDARRQVALAELGRPAYAALLHGWVHGTEPKSTTELLASKLLEPADLKHFDGAKISFNPGQAPRSIWGRPGAATPLLDLPDVRKVTKTEQEAYQAMVQRYQRLWSNALDPIALRVSLAQQTGKNQLTANLRVLPVVRDRDFLQVAELVGDQKLDPGHVRHGVRVLFAIAPDSELRRELTRSSRGLLGKELRLDWLGDYGMVGVLDRPELANAIAQTNLAPALPSANQEHVDEFEILGQLPIYLGLAVKKRSSAALLLTFLRGRFANDLASFETIKQYNDSKIVAVNVDREFTFYYALSDHALYFSLQPWVIEKLLDGEAHEQLPRGMREKRQTVNVGSESSGQFVLDVRAKANGGLLTALSWLFEDHLSSKGSRAAAEMLLVGAPTTRATPGVYEQLSLDYLGAIPLTADGKQYRQDPSVGTLDPLRGNSFRPAWPPLPIAGSSARRVLETLEQFRTQLGFDREPSPPGSGEQRSLGVTVTTRRR